MLVMLAVTLLALLIASWSGIRGQVYIECQAGVDEAQAIAQAARADAAGQDRAADRAESTATKELIRAVFAATERRQVLAAFATYDRTMVEIEARRADAERQRQLNPFPPLPSETCG